MAAQDNPRTLTATEKRYEALNDKVPPVEKLTNDGLLDLEQTPDHLVSIARDNSVNSPLLRLPAELRTKIWRYSLGGLTVYPSGMEHPRPAKYRKNGSVWLYDLKIDRQLSLPRTCRQIYSEACLIFYHENTFAFYVISAFKQFQGHIRKAHFKAIRYIAASCIYVLPDLYNELVVADPSHITDGMRPYREDRLSSVRYLIPSLLSTFPNLRTLVVTSKGFLCDSRGVRTQAGKEQDNEIMARAVHEK